MDTDTDSSSDFSPQELTFLDFLIELIVNISIREAREGRDTPVDE